MSNEDILMVLLGGLGRLPDEHLQLIIDSFTWEAADYVFDTMGENLDALVDLYHTPPAGQA